MTKTFKKFLTTFITVSALVLAGVSPAEASGPAVSISLDSTNRLTNSTVSGYGANIDLYMSVFTSAGQVSMDPLDGQNMAYVYSYGGSDLVPGLILRGTQAQLNNSMSHLRVFAPCGGGAYNLYVTVNTDSSVVNPLNGHLYQLMNDVGSWDQDKAAAEATPYPYNSSATRGYLATITSSLENRIASLISQNSLIGGSDSQTEGDWKWETGPEAGTSFFSGTGANGSVVGGLYNAWNSGEPNNWNGNEDFASLYSNGTWNDVGGLSTFITEFGGLPGDDLSGGQIAIGTLALNSSAAFGQGDGSQAHPYIVDNATRLYDTYRCSGDDVYFLQSGDINLPANWPGDGTLLGHYDGDRNYIRYADNTTVRDNFGVFRNIGIDGRKLTSVNNTNAAGNLNATGKSRVGLFASHAVNSRFDTDGAQGSITVGGAGSWQIAGFIGYFGNSEAMNINCQVDITGSEASLVSGMFAEGYGTITTVSWYGHITLTNTTGGTYVGGIIGNGEGISGSNLVALGSIDTTNYNYVGGISGIIFDSEIESGRTDDLQLDAHSGNYIGSLYGKADGGSYDSSMAAGTVAGGNYVGGIAGSAVNANFTNVENRTAITANDFAGLLIGDFQSGTFTYGIAAGDLSFRGSGAVTSRGSFGSLGGNISKIFWNPSGTTYQSLTPLDSEEIVSSHDDLRSSTFYFPYGVSIGTDFDHPLIWTICTIANDGLPFISALFTGNPCAVDQVLTPTPTISGSSVVGSTLTATPGTWDAGTTQTYRWLKDDQPISNQTALTYVTVTSDIGHVIKFEVTSQGHNLFPAVKISSGITVTDVNTPSTPGSATTEVKFGGFVGNSWVMPNTVMSGIRNWSRGHLSVTSVRCVGIVAKFGSKAWQQKVGIKRARVTCSFLKKYVQNVQFTFAYRVSKNTDVVRRGVAFVY